MLKDLSTPAITVILPVYNAAPYIAETISSILDQTFKDFELIVIDDFSQDDSLDIIRSIRDPRLHVVVNEKNSGRSFSDNRAFALARGKYIAKMDADDIALPHRLEVQYRFLESRPGISLTSSFMQTFGANHMVYTYPITPDAIRVYALFNMPVANPTVFFRREEFRVKALYYDETIQDTYGEDYDFIGRCLKQVRMENQPEVLLKYRTFPLQTKAVVHEKRRRKANSIRERLLREAGITFTQEELDLHNAISELPFHLEEYTFGQVHDWLMKLQAVNAATGFFQPAAMQEVLAERWFLLCYHSPKKWRTYYQFELSKYYRPSFKLRLKFLIKNFVFQK